MGATVSIARVRKHGLRVLCVLCGTEYRHRFEGRLRDRQSPCCGVRMLPAWHVAKNDQGEPRHRKLYARAHALRAATLSAVQKRLPL